MRRPLPLGLLSLLALADCRARHRPSDDVAPAGEVAPDASTVYESSGDIVSVASDRTYLSAKTIRNGVTQDGGDVIVRFDRDTRHLYANPAFAAATGLAVETVRGRRLHEVAHPPELVRVLAQTLASVFAERRPRTIEFDYPTPTGPRHFESRILPEPAPGESIATCLTVSRDITERVRAAAALGQSEARYRTLIEAALVGIVVHQAGVVRYANPAAIELFGYEDAREVLGTLQWESCIAPAFRQQLQARAAAAFRGETTPLHPGWELVRRDGSLRWAQSSVAAIEWDGTPALLSFIRDITELRAATDRQAALEEQLRLSLIHI